jgi:hypothetical protein
MAIVFNEIVFLLKCQKRDATRTKCKTRLKVVIPLCFFRRYQCLALDRVRSYFVNKYGSTLSNILIYNIYVLLGDCALEQTVGILI